MSKSNFVSDYGYYNILISNDTETSKEATFSETRINPVLSNMQDWLLAVVRFKVPSTSIPLFVFEEIENPPGTFTSPYYVGFSIGNTYATPLIQNIVFDPIYANTTAVNRPYSRFMYYYSSFLKMINDALLELFTTAKTNGAYTALLNPFTDPEALYFELDNTTSYLKLLLPYVAATGSPFVNDGTNPYINIHISKKLFYFLAGFNSKCLINPPLPFMDHVLLISEPEVYNNIIDLPAYQTLPARSVIQIYEDYSCLYLWNKLSRLLFTTSIPIEQELIGVKGQDGNNFQQTLLTDFEVIPNQNGNTRDYIFYFAEYPRYQNFTSNGDLRNMDLKIYFQTNDLETFPLMIPPGFESTVKIQFKRKKALELLQHSSDKSYQSGGYKLMR